MKVRDFTLFLILELLAIVWAGLVFNLVPSRLVAGALAGAYFTGLGIYLVFLRLRKFKKRWRTLTIYPALIHLFVISIPMMVQRFLQYQLEFESVRILGMEGPQFHQLSTFVFGLLIAGTIADLIRVKTKRL